MNAYNTTVFVVILILGVTILMLTGCVHQPETICLRTGLDINRIEIDSQQADKSYQDSIKIICSKKQFRSIK